jgi:DNA-binding response OmpR family regulator
MRVLLIEDYPPAVRALKLGLEEDGFAVDVATDSREGAAKAWQTDYDIIILDLLTGRDAGLALLRSWREAGLSSPVLTLAGPESPEDRVRCLDFGADDCLTKPFEFDELVARLRALARRAGPPREPILRVADLEINTAVHSVKRSGRPIYLTPREYSLLHVLAANRGRVVSRSVIRDSLYREQSDHYSNVVDVYIRYLRNKIDKGFSRPLILTRWGQGYLLREE